MSIEGRTGLHLGDGATVVVGEPIAEARRRVEEAMRAKSFIKVTDAGRVVWINPFTVTVIKTVVPDEESQ